MPILYRHSLNPALTGQGFDRRRVFCPPSTGDFTHGDRNGGKRRAAPFGGAESCFAVSFVEVGGCVCIPLYYHIVLREVFLNGTESNRFYQASD